MFEPPLSLKLNVTVDFRRVDPSNDPNFYLDRFDMFSTNNVAPYKKVRFVFDIMFMFIHL